MSAVRVTDWVVAGQPEQAVAEEGPAVPDNLAGSALVVHQPHVLKVPQVAPQGGASLAWESAVQERSTRIPRLRRSGRKAVHCHLSSLAVKQRGKQELHMKWAGR